MRLFRFLSFLVFCLIGTGSVQAQLREDILRCRPIEDESRRLACYDAISLSPAAPRSKYEAVPLAELQKYALSYRGRLVEVTGWIDVGERFFFLKADQTEAASLPIDFRSLTRTELQTFRDLCGAGCEASVEGRVGPVNFTTGIVADTLTAR